jgi:rRNA maturation RNase YbeY
VKKTDAVRLAERRLKALLRAAHALPALRKHGPKSKTWNAEVRLIGVAEMTRLNARYRRKKRPTDVLSFEAPHPFLAQGFLGELVICWPILKKQAAELGHSPRRELDVLIVHGLLHLLGLDHERSRAEAKLMARYEKKLLTSSGLIGRSSSSTTDL